MRRDDDCSDPEAAPAPRLGDPEQRSRVGDHLSFPNLLLPASCVERLRDCSSKLQASFSRPLVNLSEFPVAAEMSYGSYGAGAGRHVDLTKQQQELAVNIKKATSIGMTSLDNQTGTLG